MQQTTYDMKALKMTNFEMLIYGPLTRTIGAHIAITIPILWVSVAKSTCTSAKLKKEIGNG